MISSTKRAVPKARLRPSAQAWNTLVEMANEWESEKVGEPSAGLVGSAVRPSCTVMVRNDSGADREVGDILNVTGGTANFPTKLMDANRRPFLIGDEPDATDNVVVVLLEAIPHNASELAFGRAVLLGVATCTVNITDADHAFATPTAGDATKLTSASAGPIAILDKESTGTGDKSCMVALQSWGGAAGDTAMLAQCTGHSNSTVDVDNAPGNTYIEIANVSVNMPQSSDRTYLIFGDASVQAEVEGLSSFLPLTVHCEIFLGLWYGRWDGTTLPTANATEWIEKRVLWFDGTLNSSNDALGTLKAGASIVHAFDYYVGNPDVRDVAPISGVYPAPDETLVRMRLRVARYDSTANVVEVSTTGGLLKNPSLRVLQVNKISQSAESCGIAVAVTEGGF